MLGVSDLAIAGLVLLVVALVLRLRQHEPAAVERLGRRLADAQRELDAARAELNRADERVIALREELAQGDAVLAPLRAEREALEADVATRRVQARDAEAAVAAASRALAEQRALRAEAEAALRDAQVRLAQLEQGTRVTHAPEVRASDAHGPEVRTPTRAERPGTGLVDLAAIVASAGPSGEEPPVVMTDGAVRPTESLSPQEPDGHVTAGEERAP